MATNPYQSPKHPSGATHDKPPRSIFAKALSMFFWHWTFVVVIGIFLTFVTPRFEKSFVDFEMKIPAPTQWVLTISRFAVNFWYLIFLVAPIYFAFLLCVHSIERRIAGSSLIWATLFWLGGILFLLAATASLVLPMLFLMNNLSK